MSSFKYLFFILSISFCSITAIAQTQPEDDKEKLSLNSGTIDSQFEFIIRRSNRYQDYKVVKTNWLYTLKSHTLDSLKAVHESLANTQAIVDNQALEISTLKSNLSNTQGNLDKTNEEKNNMSLLGLQMSKTNYNLLMWFIIAGLLALLLFFIYKYKNSNSVTRLAQKSLSEIEEEFEEHRKVALEREQKVRRQLQDEINKQKT